SAARPRSSPATSSSRARSAASTCPAATGRPSPPRSPRCSTRTPTRPSSIPATWGSRRSAPSGRRIRSSRRRLAEPLRLRRLRSPPMAAKFQEPRGTFDVLPAQGRARAHIQAVAAGVFARAGDETIQTPTFEQTDLFERGVGKSTDIVRKEMFTFEDKGERSLTLRPEGTAPICRAYLGHGVHKMAQPVKLSYVGPFFRHERPQAGRYRQFHQLGIEAIGTASPLADAEVIMLLSDLLGELGVPGVVLRLGSLGSLDARAAYLEELKAHLHAHEGELTDDVRERIDINPLRAFASDDEGVKGVMAAAPTILDALSDEDAEHFAEVRSLLDAAGI